MAVIMPRFRLRRILPKSLFGRALMILIVPLTLLQVVVAAVFIERHWDGTTRQLSATFAVELEMLAAIVAAQPDAAAAQRALSDAAQPLDYAVRFEPGAQLDPRIRRQAYGLAPRALVETLRDRIDAPLSIDTVALDRHIDIRMQVAGGVLQATPRRSRLIASKPHLLLVWMVVAALVLLAVAMPFLRNQVRPIRQLADAAEAFGKGQPAPPFKPSGAEEVRRAAGAFHVMRARIERQIAQRTMMLSGVSHDLRTPLTRMRLALELAEDGPETDALKADVAEMERMIEGFLAFARDAEVETPENVDLAQMVQGIVETERGSGTEIAFETEIDEGADTWALLRPDTIRRCIQNLIGNAVKYGTHIRVLLEAHRGRVEIAVEDDGPGIPDALHEDAFKPFHRLDAARNLDKGGSSGLGLSIALDAARVHGGDIVLGQSALGGLKAVLTLPR